MTFEIAEPGWVAIARDDVTGRVSVKQVGFFEISDEGTRPLVKNDDGIFWGPGPETVEVIKTDSLHAAKLTAMHKLVTMADKATTAEEFDSIEKLGEFVMGWEPGVGHGG